MLQLLPPLLCPLLPQQWGATLLFLAVPSGNNYIVHALNSLFCNDNWMQFPLESHKWSSHIVGSHSVSAAICSEVAASQQDPK